MRRRKRVKKANADPSDEGLSEGKIPGLRNESCLIQIQIDQASLKSFETKEETLSGLFPSLAISSNQTAQFRVSSKDNKSHYQTKKYYMLSSILSKTNYTIPSSYD